MRTLLLIRTLAFVLMFLLYKNFSCFSQSTADTVRLDLLRASTTQSLRKIFEKSSSTVPSAYLLTPDWAAISKLSKFSQPGYISFQLPVSGTSALSIVIKEVPVLAKGFRVTTSSNRPIDLPAIRFYTGKLVGDDSSTVSLTISEDGIEGLVYGQSYSYTFGKIRGTDAKKLHMVYQTHEMPEKAQIECTSVEAVVTNAVKSSVQGNSTARTTAEGCRKVGIYMEADYTLYQNWGSDVA
ncbi:hypothetical protein, partial [Persicitalea sp.]|uniref:hypothetical protein n=1 Tax=Persicitalea sp. TaxID=3100273 RepID=UPI003593788B